MAISKIPQNTILIRKDYTLTYQDNITLAVHNISVPAGCNLYNCFMVPLSYTSLGIKIGGVYKVPSSSSSTGKSLYALPFSGKTFSSGDTLTVTIIFIPTNFIRDET